MSITRPQLVLLVFCTVVFGPWLDVSAQLPSIRPEWALLLLGVVFLPTSRRVLESRVLFWALAVVVSCLLSMVHGLLILGIVLDGRDLFEVLKPILYFMFFALAASGSDSVSQYVRFLRNAILILSVAAVLAVIQYFNPGVVSPILELWAPPERIELYTLSRATSTMGNPNDLGYLMTVGFALVLFVHRHHVLPRLWSWLILLLHLVAVLAAGSRTAMFCTAAVVGVFLVSRLRHGFKNLAYVSMVVVATGIVFQQLAQMEVFGETASRVTTLTNFEEDSAWVPRVEAALAALPAIKENWLVGHGPAKRDSSIDANIDNEYIFILYRYGVLGFITIGGFVLSLARFNGGAIATDEKGLAASMRQFSLAILLAGAVFAYTAGVFLSFRLFTVLILLWAVSGQLQVAGIRRGKTNHGRVDARGHV